MLDEVKGGIAQLGGIVRRDRGRHADGDPRCAIGEEVGEGARQHHRLAVLAIIGVAEIDRVLVDPVDQQRRNIGEARLGVAVGRGIVAVDIAEIALALDQRVALGKILGQAHHRVIHRLVAMGVELADDVADDAGAFLEPGARVEPEEPHRIEQPPVHRLQPVPHIRQRPVHDGGERIGKVALLERVAQPDRLDLLGPGWRGNLLAHDPALYHAGPRFGQAPASRLTHLLLVNNLRQ